MLGCLSIWNRLSLAARYSSFFPRPVPIDADLEQNPKEALQIVHEAMRLAKKRTDGHEDLGSGQT